MKLFYLIIGCTPKGRNTEQHDVFFGIAEKWQDLVPDIDAFWPEAAGQFHLDGICELQFVEGYGVKIVPKISEKQTVGLYFINLGGYRPGHFNEFHEKLIVAESSPAGAVRRAKQTDFYKKMGFPAAMSHVDDKYGVDVDEIHAVEDILPHRFREKFSIILEKSNAEIQENPMKVGYIKISKNKNQI